MVQSQRTESEDKLGWWPQRSDTNFLFPQPLTNSNNLTHSDVIQAGARTYAGRLFAEPITHCQSHNRFNTQSYLQYVRFFLGLPPALTIGGSVASSQFDYPVQRCLAEHKGTCQLLDAHGDHASSGCPSTQHARIRKARQHQAYSLSVRPRSGIGHTL